MAQQNAKNAKSAKKKKQKQPHVLSVDSLFARGITGGLMLVLGLVLFLAVDLRLAGDALAGLRIVTFRLFGAPAFMLPLLLVWAGVTLIRSASVVVRYRPLVFASLLYLLLLTLMNLIVYTGSPAMPLMEYVTVKGGYVWQGAMLETWDFCFSLATGQGRAGGVFGALLGWPLWRLTGASIGGLITGGLMALVLVLLFRLDLYGVYQKLARSLRNRPKQPRQAVPARNYVPMPQYAGVAPQPPIQRQPPQQLQQAQAWPQQQAPVNPPPQSWPTGNQSRAGFAPVREETQLPPSASNASSLLGRLRGFLDRGAQEASVQPTPVRYPSPAPAENPAPRRSTRQNAAQPESAPPAPGPTPVYAVPDAVARASQETGPVSPESEAQPRPRRSRRSAKSTASTGRQPAVQTPVDEDLPPWDVDEGTNAPVLPVMQAGQRSRYKPSLDIAEPAEGDLTLGELNAPPPEPEVPYTYPTLELLHPAVPRADIDPDEDQKRIQRLEETLQSFNVSAQVVNVVHGPAVSRFELELAPGIRVSKVTDLQQNVAMNMEAKSVRIEAPIPGKSLVGIEVPNRTIAMVTLREVLESPQIQNATKPLIVALGKDISGTPIVCDLSKMPHLLIAGQTGSGKSVCINAIINSLLYRCSPKDVRLILIDPKVVELQGYNGVPHLLLPVVSEPHKASGALAWAVDEMMLRYKKFEEYKVRGIDGYNEIMRKDGLDTMPRIVIIIDELADLMMVCKKDVEERICRIAQLARAAGIHLIVATQRPSVNVITGLIKANIPSRIAFKVASYVDSRTVLDKIGAEQLLGNGDMLYMPTGQFEPTRIQGCFLSDEEVNAVTDYEREHNPSRYDPSIIEALDHVDDEGGAPSRSSTSSYSSSDDGGGRETDSDLLRKAIEKALNDEQISTSTLQRYLRVGYARAGRIVDAMTRLGVISEPDGSKPRTVLITREEYEQMKDSL
ncbi:MAG: DUF87 domain-containing protein [Clostridia bacterium]|nr:DUF87 domain-containing protein [Clostridia bacterium]